MDWDTWVTRGIAVRDEMAPGRSDATIRKAWSEVVAARGAYLREDWTGVGTELRRAVSSVTCAMAEANGLNVLKPCTLEVSAITGRAVFGEVAEEIFERLAPASHTAHIDTSQELEPQLTRLSHSVMAASEYVALAESFLAM